MKREGAGSVSSIIAVAGLLTLLLSNLAGCADSPEAAQVGANSVRVEHSLLGETNEGYPVRQVLTGLSEPWGMSFLDNGELLITQKSGELYRYTGDEVHKIAGVPPVAVVGQGGLLDVLAVPVAGGDRWIYLSYSIAGKGGYSTRVMRARLLDDQLIDQEILFTAAPFYEKRRHFGSRLLVDDAGYLFITVGDRGNRAAAQDLGSHAGKVIRLFTDGSVPEDNPFRDTTGARPEIYSYGHRNPQGIAIHPTERSLWISEHGPQGGDEINRLVPAGNYGWPVVSYGEEYGGGKIGIGTHKPGVAGPAEYFLPSVGTSGMLFYSHKHLPAYRTHLLLGMLRGRGFSVENGAHFRTDIAHAARRRTGVKSEMEALPFRVRDMEQAPDGSLWMLADGSKLIHISRYR